MNHFLYFKPFYFLASVEQANGPRAGGTIDKYHPKSSQFSTLRHLKEDIYPWFLCCRLCSKCGLYYENRPSDDGSGYRAPEICKIYENRILYENKSLFVNITVSKENPRDFAVLLHAHLQSFKTEHNATLYTPQLQWVCAIFFSIS